MAEQRLRHQRWGIGAYSPDTLHRAVAKFIFYLSVYAGHAVRSTGRRLRPGGRLPRGQPSGRTVEAGAGAYVETKAACITVLPAWKRKLK